MLSDFHPVNVINPPVEVIKREDGSQIVRCIAELGPYPKRLTDRLEYWAQLAPNRLFVAQRSADGHWENYSYADSLQKIRSVASWLLTQKLSTERPIAVLSGNSVEHLFLALAAMYIGIPYSPISPAYSLISTDYGKLRHIVELLTPGLVFIDNLGPYRGAIDTVLPAETPILSVSTDHALDGLANPVSAIGQAMAFPIDPQIEVFKERVDGDTVAKLLFTSGSTGMPKGVINTQRMLCSNQEMIASVLAFLRDKPPVMLEWLPWNHTFGGNQNMGIAIYNGGTLYIDYGKPTESAIGETLDNLKDVSPTVYFNVPKGYELLVKKLREYPSIAKKFFSNLEVMYFAAAGLSQHIWDALDELSLEHTGKKIPMLTGLGSTETAPAAVFASIEECASGVIGTPAPGIEIKLVPNGDKLEARIKAPSITTGYWRQPELTVKAFDQEGFYCLGDAFKYIDPNKPNRGFRFDGRVSEDFKLDTGTWVSVGTLRSHIIHHFAPYIQDVVIAGHDRSYLSVLVFPDMGHCRHLVPDSEAISDTELLRNPHLRQTFARLLAEMAAGSSGSSTKVVRMMLLDEPAKIDANEATDKGSLNQRAVLANRAHLVEELYKEVPGDDVISLKR